MRRRTFLKAVPLGNVAGKTRSMPIDFLAPEENQLSEAGITYLQRLLPQKFTVGEPFVG